MNTIQKIIYYIGKRSKTIRLVYWKRTNHRWLWGILKGIQDLPKEKTCRTTVDDTYIDDILDAINNMKDDPSFKN